MIDRTARIAFWVMLLPPAVGACSLIVGDPHGDHVFATDATDATTGADAPGVDAAPAVDASFGTDAPVAADVSSPPMDAGLDVTSSTDARGQADGPSAADAGHDSGSGGGCPGSAGPSPTVVQSAEGPYCIDSTEVTNAQYAVFLASTYAPVPSAVAAGCVVEGGAPSYVPTAGWPAAPGFEKIAVVDVTWCDAYAYCNWAGKRMCGQIGGGPVASQNATNPAEAQWYNACSNGGTLLYPYGPAFVAGACGGQAARSMGPEIVGPPTACVGGLPGLYNMSGNVWEWTDDCSSAAPGSQCQAFGGAFDSTQPELECVGTRPWTRTSGAGNIGIRCCGDL